MIMFKKFVELYKKYEEAVLYLFFGGVGTIISIASYWLLRQIGFDYIASNIISWIITVVVMYITNRKFVFKSKSSKIILELFSFITARVLTLFFETGIIFLAVEVFSWHDMIGKIIGQIFVIISNYLLSKFLIFNNKKKDRQSRN